MREARSRFSPGSRGRGSDLERGLCPAHPGAPPFAPPSGPPSPFILSYGVSPAPPSGLVFGGLCFRSPKPWGPSVQVSTPGPSRALSFSPAAGDPISLSVSAGLGAPVLSVPSNSSFSPCSPPPSFSCTCLLPYPSSVLILFLEVVWVKDLFIAI